MFKSCSGCLQMKRYLITTADERTWKFDEPVLFLGKWCQHYHRKHIWKGMDALVAEPYGLHQEQKERDIAYVQELTTRLLKELVEALNLFHNTDHSHRFWQIVVGHWLQRYISVVYNRFFTLVQTLKNNSLSATKIIDASCYRLATNDSLNFIWACNDDVWNHILYARILDYLGEVKFDSISVDLPTVFCIEQKANEMAISFFDRKYFVNLLQNLILPKLSKKRDAVIINSYLPKTEEAKLAISLGQCPQFWRSPSLKMIKYNQEKRQNFVVCTDNYDGFELFLRRQLREIIPICYLEGFEQLMLQVKELPWPVSPKFIFTSNNFDTDEVFKVWTGCNIEKGVPYFVGQHGNNYGTLKESLNFPEVLTCDKFYSWGWTNQNSKNIPAFLFKKAGSNLKKLDYEGGLLLIETHLPHRIEVSDSEYNFDLYQQEQFKFVEMLPQDIQQRLIVRLPRAWRNTHWADEKRWYDHHPAVRVELGTEKIERLVKKSRLVVHSYDSTGTLETLASNIPTICFWRGGLDHLLPFAKPYYEMLRNVQIIVDSAEEAACLVAMHWSNIRNWWENDELQFARKSFCNVYAKIESRPVQTLKCLLMSQVTHK